MGRCRKGVSSTVLHIRGELLHLYPWGEQQGPGGRAGQNPAEADTMGKIKEEELVSVHGGFYRWLVYPSSQ